MLRSASPETVGVGEAEGSGVGVARARGRRDRWRWRNARSRGRGWSHRRRGRDGRRRRRRRRTNGRIGIAFNLVLGAAVVRIDGEEIELNRAAGRQQPGISAIGVVSRVRRNGSARVVGAETLPGGRLGPGEILRVGDIGKPAQRDPIVRGQSQAPGRDGKKRDRLIGTAAVVESTGSQQNIIPGNEIARGDRSREKPVAIGGDEEQERAIGKRDDVVDMRHRAAGECFQPARIHRGGKIGIGRGADEGKNEEKPGHGRNLHQNGETVNSGGPYSSEKPRARARCIARPQTARGYP